VAFGKDYISNPDLVQRLRRMRPQPMAAGHLLRRHGEGYTDYPALA
jgi:2,4-dienoyl-CoA reductase-like NADH-dependent reductase (Old Yellow Enzyme family)